MNTTILVAAHKPYWMPDDEVYLPIHAGRAGKADLGYVGDDTGDNMSARNPNYCELTVLYWAWKNLSCDCLGLCHYRRYFARRSMFGRSAEAKKAGILHREDYERLMGTCDVLLPARRHYYIETVRSQYEHAHQKKDLEAAERIIREMAPDYSEAFEAVMGRSSLCLWNMFVMRKDLFDRYCQWLFPILFALERRIDISGYSPYEARIFGFLAERLFNVWLERENLVRRECPVVNLEPINWPEKIGAFLRRKFR